MAKSVAKKVKTEVATGSLPPFVSLEDRMAEDAKLVITLRDSIAEQKATYEAARLRVADYMKISRLTSFGGLLLVESPSEPVFEGAKGKALDNIEAQLMGLLPSEFIVKMIDKNAVFNALMSNKKVQKALKQVGIKLVEGVPIITLNREQPKT